MDVEDPEPWSGRLRTDHILRSRIEAWIWMLTVQEGRKGSQGIWMLKTRSPGLEGFGPIISSEGRSTVLRSDRDLKSALICKAFDGVEERS